MISKIKEIQPKTNSSYFNIPFNIYTGHFKMLTITIFFQNGMQIFRKLHFSDESKLKWNYAVITTSGSRLENYMHVVMLSQQCGVFSILEYTWNYVYTEVLEKYTYLLI